MKVWPLKDASGALVGFEVPHRFVSSGRIARFFAQLPGVRVIAQRRLFEIGNDVHARLEFSGQRFIVCEPWGDSSRLSVLPEEGTSADSASLTALMDLVAGPTAAGVRETQS